MSMESRPGETAGVKADLENTDFGAAAVTIQRRLKQRNTPLNVAITGESGSGKSTFINAFRGIGDEDEGAAPTGVVETTSQVTPYPHPKYPSVILWDLPGIGTTRFPADEYLKLVGFEKFDFFIIISDSRFRENDVKLAQEIQRMKKKFYFVRSKVDKDIRAEKKTRREFNMERTLSTIRKNCTQGLRDLGIKSPQVFLVSTFELHLYDFPLLQQTLERDLPEHQRDVLLFGICNIIKKKKEVFQAEITLYATLSAAVRTAPLGISSVFDSTLKAAVTGYVAGFGLDSPSLKRLAAITGVSYTDLCAVINSPLATNTITTDLILDELTTLPSTAKIMRADNVCRFIPLFGSLLTAGFSFTISSRALQFFLSELADDAERVFRRALNLTSSVWYC
uniref:interferon-inducible GTPase 5-like n=1 Tax=Maylandia zebra TaxID=106582 RepID=UPI000D311805|nr:interferon-inducible GTPase 5-like [Maylandia zebra]